MDRRAGWGRMRRGGLGGDWGGDWVRMGRDEAGGARSGRRVLGQGGLRRRRMGRGSTGRSAEVGQKREGEEVRWGRG